MKYANPDDPRSAGRARGRKPRWVEAWLVQAIRSDALLIK